MWKHLKFIDYAIIIAGIVFSAIIVGLGIFLGIKIGNKEGIDVGATVGVNLALVGLLLCAVSLIFGMIKDGLANIDNRVDLYVKHNEGIGKLLNNIIRLLPNANEIKRKEVKKRFNGIYYKLRQEGLEKDLGITILDEIENNLAFCAISSFPVEWWFHPEGIFYLTKQLLAISKKEKRMERFAIYSFSSFCEYVNEFLDLCEVHEKAGGDFKMLILEELNEKQKEIFAQMEGTEKDTTKQFIDNYIKKSKGLWPDGIIISNKIAYLRNAKSWKIERLENSDLDNFNGYIKFLNVACKNNTIQLSRPQLEQILKE